MNYDDITIKVAVAGNVDSGKSTIAGVLIHDKLDDGRGSSRKFILKNKHELETGRTSAISHNKMIKVEGNQRKVVSFIDLAGHEKYLKTTMYGLTGLFIDYGILMIGSNMGITKMTKEHLGVLLYLKVPTIILMSKIDLCPDNIYQATERTVRKILKIPIFNKRGYFFPTDEEKCEQELEEFSKLENPLETFVPVIPMSNKTGVNINNIKKFLYSLPSRKKWQKPIEGSIMYVDSTFMVNGIGLVLSGTVRGNPIKVNQKLWLGPLNNTFIPFRVRSEHNDFRENVEELTDGMSGCIAVKPINKEIISRKSIKKGVLVFDNEDFKKYVSNKFKAEISILHHSTTIKNNYQAIIHCGPIRQSASIKILEILDGENDKSLRTGSQAVVEFTFAFRPEFLETGLTFFFRDGSTKGYGKITEIIPMELK